MKIDAPVPNGGITTVNSPPEPVVPGPKIPSIASISIDAVVYPIPGEVTTTLLIWPGIVWLFSSSPSETVISTKPPSPSPAIGTPV